MAKKKNFDLVSIIVCGVLFVATVLAIVGICIAWLQVTSSSTLTSTSSTSTSTLKELLDSGYDITGLGANTAFAIMTVVFTGLTLVAYVVSKFVDVKILSYVILALGILAVISAVVTLITSFTVANSFGSVDWGDIAKVTTTPAAGPWLLSIFGLVGGAAGAFGAVKK